MRDLFDSLTEMKLLRCSVSFSVFKNRKDELMAYLSGHPHWRVDGGGVYSRYRTEFHFGTTSSQFHAEYMINN